MLQPAHEGNSLPSSSNNITDRNAASQPLRQTAWWREAAATWAVLGALGGVAWWGHRSDWKLGAWGAPAATADADWCDAHNVPEAECIECSATLVSAMPEVAWCADHGLPQCTLHHPELAQLPAPPQVTADDFARAERALAVMPRPENARRCRLDRRRIQFASLAAMERAGVDIALVERRSMVESVSAPAELVYDPNAYVQLSSPVTGIAWKVTRHLGEAVAAGELLALIDAQEIGAAKTRLLESLVALRVQQAALARLSPLAQQGAVAGKQLAETRMAIEEAEIRLLNGRQSLANHGLPVDARSYDGLSLDEVARTLQFLGITESEQQALGAEIVTSNLFPMRSPLSGTVVERKVVAGEVVSGREALFAVADTARLWLILQVRLEDIALVRTGMPVRFQPSHAASASPSLGEIEWIASHADEATRTVQVRVAVDNPRGEWRANTFGQGQIIVRDESAAIVVPSEAVHWDGGCHIVFVRDKHFLQANAPKFFHVRPVRIGVQQGGYTEIIAGVFPGEVLASRGSAILEAQLLKANLGAGCCEAP